MILDLEKKTDIMVTIRFLKYLDSNRNIYNDSLSTYLLAVTDFAIDTAPTLPTDAMRLDDVHLPIHSEAIKMYNNRPLVDRINEKLREKGVNDEGLLGWWLIEYNRAVESLWKIRNQARATPLR